MLGAWKPLEPCKNLYCTPQQGVSIECRNNHRFLVARSTRTQLFLTLRYCISKKEMKPRYGSAAELIALECNCALIFLFYVSNSLLSAETFLLGADSTKYYPSRLTTGEPFVVLAVSRFSNPTTRITRRFSKYLPVNVSSRTEHEPTFYFLLHTLLYI